MGALSGRGMLLVSDRLDTHRGQEAAASVVESFPSPFGVSAFASRVILFPAGVYAFLTVGLPARRLDPDGVSTFHMRKTRTEWAPSIPRGRWCSSDRLQISGRHLPHPSGTSLTSARSRIPSTRTFNMTRHQPRVHPYSPARPSPHPWSSEGTRTLRLEPWASHPAVARDARQGGDRPLSTDRGSRHHRRLLHRDPLNACDLVSHSALLPSKACTISGNPFASESSPTVI